jgi:hypothetical protein
LIGTPWATQHHRQRREQEGRVELAGLERLDHRRELGEALRREARAGGGRLGREVGDRAGEVTGHRQEADVERVAGAGRPTRHGLW